MTAVAEAPLRKGAQGWAPWRTGGRCVRSWWYVIPVRMIGVGYVLKPESGRGGRGARVPGSIVRGTIRRIPSDAWWALPDMGVGTPGDHRGPQPGIVIIPAGSLSDDENPVRKEIVAAVIEVVSKNTRSEDYGDKPETYASMGIPIYVIIDRKCETIRVFSEPDVNRYTRENVSPFGKPFTLPEPVLLTIGTEGYPAAL